MKLTVKDLRKSLKGLPSDMPVYLADHDHGNGETNGRAGSVYIEDQLELGEKWLQNNGNKDFLIKGKYLVIRVG